ncbi:hypothetical protein [Sulfitobacter albidus]|nr:hypothetical protein [Sulfitobacter albidus]
MPSTRPISIGLKLRRAVGASFITGELNREHATPSPLFISAAP